MGVLIVESSRAAANTEEVFIVNGIKDNKKKKRRSRKSKQNHSLFACSSVSEICIDDSRLAGGYVASNHVVSDGHHEWEKEYNAGFSSITEIDLKNQIADGNLTSQASPLQEIKIESYYNSGPEPAVKEEAVGPILLAQPVDCRAARKCYPPHWSAGAISKGLEEGGLLRALFHVNAYNNLEAYCKIEGLQTDILISGVEAQNRAIEGDTVAIVIDHPSLWPQMKGLSETPNNSNSLQPYEALKCMQDSCNGSSKLDTGYENVNSSSYFVGPDNGTYLENGPVSGAIPDDICINGISYTGHIDGYRSLVPNSASPCSDDPCETMISVENLFTLLSLLPSKRPTGRVVAVLERSSRRSNVVGFLSVKQWINSRGSKRKDSRRNKHKSDVNDGYILLKPTNPKFMKMMVYVRDLPGSIQKRLEAGDVSIEAYLVAAKVVDWAEESYMPEACIIQIFGRGSDIEAQIAAILFENAINASEFSSEALSYIPHIPWEVPSEELQSRRDLRNLCIFTVDPASATDLDDALSVERLPSSVFRVGVHIADVSYFVRPDTALDVDAQIRSTTVYLVQRKLPMLPPMLSDNLASLNPGVDRLAFSIFWDINTAGEILDRWMGRTIIRSCSKLSYEHAQEIIDGVFSVENSRSMGNHWPELYGQFEWSDVIESVKALDRISKILKENRFKNGALSLECPKIGFLFDEEGMPYDNVLSGQKESNFLVEEFMLLANMTVAEVITRAYPSCSLLRRHPEPNVRKLREFETFCYKHGLELDISSSALLHQSLEHIREDLSNDSVLFNILMSYAARPMQLAVYFCSGNLKDSENDWCHYALAVPLYTHFTSPLRRYPDIVVHRTLAATLEAEDIYLKRKKLFCNLTEEEVLHRCFTGLQLCKADIESVEAEEALYSAASKHGVPRTEILADVAAHCNEKKLASRRVKDATDKLYMWALLKKKEILYCEARVLGLGPRFMSIYIPKLAIEQRIYYGEVEGLIVEWLDATSTLLLSQSMHKRSNRKNSPGKCKSLEEVALIVSPTDLELEMDLYGCCEGKDGESLRCEGVSGMTNHQPSVFPLTVHILSTIPVALHAIGGDDGPLDIVARLYISSYFH